MEIGLYEAWMKPQIADLFSKQYEVGVDEFSKLIDDFYEHPYQKHKCIRIVATEKTVIIGFQSFFYWPYSYNGITYNSYQSGNSLVHPDYRGKGIFQKLLSYLDNHQKELNIDFLIGFPIIDSKNSLLRNNWVNLFNLQWYIKLINPFSVLMPVNIDKLKRVFNDKLIHNLEKPDYIRLSNSNEFIQWRADYSGATNYVYFTYIEKEKIIQFQMKLVIRKRIIKELQIGDVKTNCNNDMIFLVNGINKLIKKTREVSFLSILSVALNENADSLLINSLLKTSFKRTNKSIFFMVKPFINLKELINADNWLIYRSDIDTW